MGRTLSMTLALLCLMAGAANAEVLISAEEAARPLPPKDIKIATRAVGRPPAVESDYKPDQAKPQKSPFNLSLKFIAHGGAKIDVKDTGGRDAATSPIKLIITPGGGS